MKFKGYNDLSSNIHEQIANLCAIWTKYLGKDIIGIYIHGSMSLNCFVEGTSDIDVLVVTNRKIPREERLLIARDIMSIDAKPCPLEISALWIGDINPWKYPTPCQFHYSDYWTERYNKLLSGELEKCTIVDTDFTDEDIACHIMLTNQCGICVMGKPINEVFPIVPEKDFWSSISCDIDEYDFHAYNPKYFTSNILILGRILSYKKEKKILSKYEGGLWTLNYVPEKYKYIIQNALQVWYEGKEIIKYKEEDLINLRQLLVDEIHK